MKIDLNSLIDTNIKSRLFKLYDSIFIDDSIDPDISSTAISLITFAIKVENHIEVLKNHKDNITNLLIKYNISINSFNDYCAILLNKDEITIKAIQVLNNDIIDYIYDVIYEYINFNNNIIRLGRNIMLKTVFNISFNELLKLFPRDKYKNSLNENISKENDSKENKSESSTITVVKLIHKDITAEDLKDIFNYNENEAKSK